jgi:hypothetical protein
MDSPPTEALVGRRSRRHLDLQWCLWNGIGILAADTGNNGPDREPDERAADRPAAYGTGDTVARVEALNAVRAGRTR